MYNFPFLLKIGFVFIFVGNVKRRWVEKMRSWLQNIPISVESWTVCLEIPALTVRWLHYSFATVGISRLCYSNLSSPTIFKRARARGCVCVCVFRDTSLINHPMIDRDMSPASGRASLSRWWHTRCYRHTADWLTDLWSIACARCTFSD